MKLAFFRVALLTLFVSSTAFAQHAPKVEFFGGYSYVRSGLVPSSSGKGWHGWNAAVTGNVNPWLGIRADFSGVSNDVLGFSPLGDDVSMKTFLFGPQVSYRKNPRWTPFAHALFGAARAKSSQFVIIGPNPSASESAFASALGGGVDLNLGLSFGIRVFQADYLITRFRESSGVVCAAVAGLNCPGPKRGTQSNLRLSFGLIFRVGGR